MPKTKRLFFSICPNEDCLNHIVNFQTRIISNAEISQKYKIIPKENIHLTMRFIGNVSEEEYPLIEKVLTDLDMKYSTFNLEVSSGDFFPTIFFLKASAKGIENLYNDIDRRLVTKGFCENKHDFKPHITLMRFKNPVKEDCKERIKGVAFKPKTFAISNVYLMQSILSDEGAKYKTLSQIRLI